MIKNKIKSIIYKLYIIANQRYHKMKNGKYLKYILIRNKSNKLFVTFSGFPNKNSTAKYNYMRTLKQYEVNKLFILDDVGYGKKGSYYLGENGDYFLEEEIISLIDRIKKKYNLTETCALGTSKGGWAALYYGIKLKCNMIIAGAPQYYIGDYLNTNEYHKKILEGIVGDIDNKKIEELNNKLPNVIKRNKSENTKFIIHYSKEEHTYEEHIKFLLEDLKNKYSNTIIEDIGCYKEHGEVGEAFKKLCGKIFEKEI